MGRSSYLAELISPYQITLKSHSREADTEKPNALI